MTSYRVVTFFCRKNSRSWKGDYCSDRTPRPWSICYCHPRRYHLLSRNVHPNHYYFLTFVLVHWVCWHCTLISVFTQLINLNRTVVLSISRILLSITISLLAIKYSVFVFSRNAIFNLCITRPRMFWGFTLYTRRL